MHDTDPAMHPCQDDRKVGVKQLLPDLSMHLAIFRRVLFHFQCQ
jgi:hypothetical protein